MQLPGGTSSVRVGPTRSARLKLSSARTLTVTSSPSIRPGVAVTAVHVVGGTGVAKTAELSQDSFSTAVHASHMDMHAEAHAPTPVPVMHEPELVPAVAQSSHDKAQKMQRSTAAIATHPVEAAHKNRTDQNSWAGSRASPAAGLAADASAAGGASMRAPDHNLDTQPSQVAIAENACPAAVSTVTAQTLLSSSCEQGPVTPGATRTRSRRSRSRASATHGMPAQHADAVAGTPPAAAAATLALSPMPSGDSAVHLQGAQLSTSSTPHTAVVSEESGTDSGGPEGVQLAIAEPVKRRRGRPKKEACSSSSGSSGGSSTTGSSSSALVSSTADARIETNAATVTTTSGGGGGSSSSSSSSVLVSKSADASSETSAITTTTTSGSSSGGTAPQADSAPAPARRRGRRSTISNTDSSSHAVHVAPDMAPPDAPKSTDAAAAVAQATQKGRGRPRSRVPSEARSSSSSSSSSSSRPRGLSRATSPAAGKPQLIDMALKAESWVCVHQPQLGGEARVYVTHMPIDEGVWQELQEGGGAPELEISAEGLSFTRCPDVRGPWHNYHVLVYGQWDPRKEQCGPNKIMLLEDLPSSSEAGWDSGSQDTTRKWPQRTSYNVLGLDGLLTWLADPCAEVVGEHLANAAAYFVMGQAHRAEEGEEVPRRKGRPAKLHNRVYRRLRDNWSRDTLHALGFTRMSVEAALAPHTAELELGLATAGPCGSSSSSSSSAAHASRSSSRDGEGGDGDGGGAGSSASCSTGSSSRGGGAGSSEDGSSGTGSSTQAVLLAERVASQIQAHLNPSAITGQPPRQFSLVNHFRADLELAHKAWRDKHEAEAAALSDKDAADGSSSGAGSSSGSGHSTWGYKNSGGGHAQPGTAVAGRSVQNEDHISGSAGGDSLWTESNGQLNTAAPGMAATAAGSPSWESGRTDGQLAGATMQAHQPHLARSQASPARSQAPPSQLQHGSSATGSHVSSRVTATVGKAAATGPARPQGSNRSMWSPHHPRTRFVSPAPRKPSPGAAGLASSHNHASHAEEHVARRIAALGPVPRQEQPRALPLAAGAPEDAMGHTVGGGAPAADGMDEVTGSEAAVSQGSGSQFEVASDGSFPGTGHAVLGAAPASGLNQTSNVLDGTDATAVAQSDATGAGASPGQGQDQVQAQKEVQGAGGGGGGREGVVRTGPLRRRSLRRSRRLAA